MLWGPLGELQRCCSCIGGPLSNCLKISLEAKRKIIEEQIIIDYISFLVYCTLHILSLGYTYKMLIVLTISRSFEPKPYWNNMLNMLERKHCLIKFCYMLTDYGTALGGGNYEAEGDGRLYHGLQRRHL